MSAARANSASVGQPRHPCQVLSFDLFRFSCSAPLTAVHVGLAISLHLTWAAAGGTLAETLGRTRPRRVLEATSGVALLALAAKLARSG